MGGYEAHIELKEDALPRVSQPFPQSELETIRIQCHMNMLRMAISLGFSPVSKWNGRAQRFVLTRKENE